MSLLFIPRLPSPVLLALALASSSSQPAAFPVVVAFFQKEMKGKSFDGDSEREGGTCPPPSPSRPRRLWRRRMNSEHAAAVDVG